MYPASQGVLVQGFRDIKRLVRQEILSGRLSPGDRLPTGRELCQQYGVSHLTVDRALRELAQEGLVFRQPRRGTFVAQRQAGYRGTVALLTTTLASVTTFPELVAGIEATVAARNFRFQLLHILHDFGKAREAARRVIDDEVEGVIYVPVGGGEAFAGNIPILRSLQAHHLPVVVAGHCNLPGPDPVSGVTSDHSGGAQAMIRHLIGCGHERIALLGWHPNGDSSFRRTGFSHWADWHPMVRLTLAVPADGTLRARIHIRAPWWTPNLKPSAEAEQRPVPAGGGESADD